MDMFVQRGVSNADSCLKIATLDNTKAFWFRYHYKELSEPELAHLLRIGQCCGILYADRSTDHGSRTAQQLPRQLRLLMSGATHLEVDIIGTFYEIVLRTVGGID